MQAQLGMRAMCILHQSGIGQDDGIGAEFGGAVHRLRPARPIVAAGIGVERQQHLAPLRVGVADAVPQRRVVEIQAAEIARVGLVAEAGIDAVGTVVHGGLECRQTAGRANEFELFGAEWHGEGSEKSNGDYRRRSGSAT